MWGIIGFQSDALRRKSVFMIIGEFMVPHPPLIIPEIGGEACRQKSISYL